MYHLENSIGADYGWNLCSFTVHSASPIETQFQFEQLFLHTMSLPSSSDPLWAAVWFREDSNVATVVSAYTADKEMTVRTIVDVMFVPCESGLKALCRRMVERCPRNIINDVIVYLRNKSLKNVEAVLCGAVVAADIQKNMDNVVTLVESVLTTPAAAPLSSPAAPSVPLTQTSESEPQRVVVPVRMGNGLSLDMKVLGCPYSVMQSKSCDAASASYTPTNETSAMTGLEWQFVTDPVLLHLAQTRAPIATLYHYLNHRYPGIVSAHQGETIAHWKNCCAGLYPLEVVTLEKGKGYVRHLLMNSGSCPASGGYYYFKEAPSPSNIVRF